MKLQFNNETSVHHPNITHITYFISQKFFHADDKTLTLKLQLV